MNVIVAFIPVYLIAVGRELVPDDSPPAAALAGAGPRKVARGRRERLIALGLALQDHIAPEAFLRLDQLMLEALAGLVPDDPRRAERVAAEDGPGGTNTPWPSHWTLETAIGDPGCLRHLLLVM